MSATASPARIAANQANALKSKGPTSEEGKARSRANSYKHGLTGAGVVMPVEDAAEVERRAAAFEAEMKPSGEVGRTLLRHAALMSVRMERCADQEMAATSARVRQVLDEFEAPEGLVDPAEIDHLRAEAGDIALFDPSKPACLARKYEAAAARGFFRSIKEFRQVERAAKAAPEPSPVKSAAEALGSFLREAKPATARPVATPKPAPLPPSKPVRAPESAFDRPLGDSFFVPIAIGRPR